MHMIKTVITRFNQINKYIQWGKHYSLKRRLSSGSKKGTRQKKQSNNDA